MESMVLIPPADEKNKINADENNHKTSRGPNLSAPPFIPGIGIQYIAVVHPFHKSIMLGQHSLNPIGLLEFLISCFHEKCSICLWTSLRRKRRQLPGNSLVEFRIARGRRSFGLICTLEIFFHEGRPSCYFG
jgi:hypothetical protein